MLPVYYVVFIHPLRTVAFATSLFHVTVGLFGAARTQHVMGWRGSFTALCRAAPFLHCLANLRRVFLGLPRKTIHFSSDLCSHTTSATWRVRPRVTAPVRANVRLRVRPRGPEASEVDRNEISLEMKDLQEENRRTGSTTVRSLAAGPRG